MWTVYMVYARMGSPTLCGSSTVITNTGLIPFSFFAPTGVEIEVEG